jgi:glucosamine-6-phosphate deaminase
MSSLYVPNVLIPTLVFPDSTQASRHVALIVRNLITHNNALERPTVLGLATGSTPLGVYREFRRMREEEGLDFSRVVTFNLDEYYPMKPGDEHSYHRFMHENLFKYLNIPESQIFIPKGTWKRDEVEKECMRYEQLIRQKGGLDLQILGIGRTGHIGFNEPGSARSSRTRLVTLDPVTRLDAAGGFYGEENVPHHAITMGIGTIMEARQVILMSFGEHKAPIVRHMVEEPPSINVPASFLQHHADTTVILDQAAAGELSACRRPWELGSIQWSDDRIRQAVIWLSLEVKKPLLKLNDQDFREHKLHELLREHGPAQDLGQHVFQDRMATICTEPAGAERRTILVFSPHPDDDVISMGGTLIRLVEQGHQVHVAYMTSGNVAVFDHDAWRFIDFVRSFNKFFAIDQERTGEIQKCAEAFLCKRRPGEIDSDELLEIKKLIRETEARAAASACGIAPSHLEFMNLRFYRTGLAEKKPIDPQDLEDIQGLLKRLQPHQIYLAGEMSDPHGTHRICAEAIFEAVRRVRQQNQDFEVWLYRGAWEEWQPYEIERAVPLCSYDLERKKLAIFRHQSQKDRAMYPGASDTREFWQRAEDRNRDTARLYDRLGLPEYYALEGFVRWKGP